MNKEIIDSFTSSLSSPYKEFCEEYIRLAEMIMEFEQDQIEMIEKIEQDEITSLLIGVKTRLSFLGENGIRQHFKITKARIIKESIEKNSGLRQVYEMLNSYIKKHPNEREKMGMSLRNNSSLTTVELLDNYEKAVIHLKNFNIQSSIHNKN